MIHHSNHQYFWLGTDGKGGVYLYDKRTEINKTEGIKNTRSSEAARNMEAARKQMLARLEQLRENGVELYVDGREALPDEAVSKAVRENSPYMADYVLDASGTIEQVRFDKVTRW